MRGAFGRAVAVLKEERAVDILCRPLTTKNALPGSPAFQSVGVEGLVART